MNAGKTTTLLQSAHNYQERGMDTLIFTPVIDDRYEVGLVKSRIGLSSPAIVFRPDTDLFARVKAEQKNKPKLRCILIDEAQFMTEQQVRQITAVVDVLNYPVLTYGLRTDFQGQLFPGSQYLLAWAEEIVEIKTVCDCGRKATNNMRINAAGEPVSEGEQIEVGGNDRYIASCRRCFDQKLKNNGQFCFEYLSSEQI